MKSRTLLRLTFLALLTWGLSLAPDGILAATGAATACPNVSCLTETGYNECTQAGCTCDPRTDACVAKKPDPDPVPACPTVSCLTQEGYEQCVQAKCGCDPRTDACGPIKVISGLNS